MITTLEGQSVWVTQEPTLQEVISGNYTLPVNFKVVDATNDTYKMVSYVFDSVNGARRLESGGGSVSGDSYSTDEIKTGGTWVDGRPIYRRAIKQNLQIAGNNVGVINLTVDGVGEIVNFGGNFKYYDEVIRLATYFTGSGSIPAVSVTAKADPPGNTLSLVIISSDGNYTGEYLMVSAYFEYTKATDTSSFGNPE